LSTNFRDAALAGMAIVITSQQPSTQSARPTNGPRHTAQPIPAALLAFLGVLFFLNIVSRLCVGPLLPVIERDFGLRHSGAGSLYFFLAAGSCVGLYLSGHLAWRLYPHGRAGTRNRPAVLRGGARLRGAQQAAIARNVFPRKIASPAEPVGECAPCRQPNITGALATRGWRMTPE